MATNPDRNQRDRELESVAGEAVAAERRAELEAAPRDLFGLPVRLPRRHRNSALEEPADRPPRQVRRHTLVSVTYLLEKFGNPIEGLLRMASYDVDDLALFLQISRHDAWIEKRLLLAMAAPYVVSKMPQGLVVAPVTGLTVTGFNFGGAEGVPAEQSDAIEHQGEVTIDAAGDVVLDVEPDAAKAEGLAWDDLFGRRPEPAPEAADAPDRATDEATSAGETTDR
jgi:hypothetical protein